ncbi:hypothetical protein M9458_021150, partial [Cirrhinus mrigala]
KRWGCSPCGIRSSGICSASRKHGRCSASRGHGCCFPCGIPGTCSATRKREGC